jgi:prevent-host-death family protein
MEDRMPTPARRKPARRPARPATPRAPRRWPLQDAKAHFSELVRRANSEGPQRVTVHGRASVVVLSEADYARLSGQRSGKELVDLLRKSPLGDLVIEHPAVTGPVRDVEL